MRSELKLALDAPVAHALNVQEIPKPAGRLADGFPGLRCVKLRDTLKIRLFRGWTRLLASATRPMSGPLVNSIERLVGIAVALGASHDVRVTAAEHRIARTAARVDPEAIAAARKLIIRGADPLGVAFTQLHAARKRRSLGATYTPDWLVRAMVAWVKRAAPDRIVDAGAGSGRFIVAAGRQLPHAQLVAVEVDPLAALMLRAQLAVTGLTSRCSVQLRDYRALELGRISGRTAFIGNPPYVRHHLISQPWKRWYFELAARFGIRASKLAGLHAHFLFATAQMASEHDVGCLVTAAEWLDVNYGSALRQLLLEHMGLRCLSLVEPCARPFSDADTTAVVCCFEKGHVVRRVRVSRVDSLAPNDLSRCGQLIDAQRLRDSSRWTTLTRRQAATRQGFIELGELCRVHRGQVTGNNRVWIVAPNCCELPRCVLFAAITRARELFMAGFAICDAAQLRYVIDIPPDLDQLPPKALELVERFLVQARRAGADRAYVARHRKAWWSVGLREPAPILASYMARRPPTFVRNLAQVRHVNIAHGLYPKYAMSAQVLDELTRYLQKSVSCEQGRVYAGGLTKFEPKEMERLLVPEPV